MCRIRQSHSLTLTQHPLPSPPAAPEASCLSSNDHFRPHTCAHTPSTTIVINHAAIPIERNCGQPDPYQCPRAPLACALAACGGTFPGEGASRAFTLTRTLTHSHSHPHRYSIFNNLSNSALESSLPSATHFCQFNTTQFLARTGALVSLKQMLWSREPVARQVEFHAIVPTADTMSGSAYESV